MIRIFVLFVFLLDITFTDSACTNTLPLSAGTWKTSNRGTWTINSGQTSIANFEFRTSSTGSASTATMECEDDSDTDGYIALKSSATFSLFGGDKYVYVCIKFEQQTVTNSDAYYFYFGSDLTTIAVGIYERIIVLPTGLTFTFALYCKDKSTAAERTHVAIKNDTEANAAITCPTSIQGTFSYSNTSCSSTFLDVCTTLTQFNFNYTVCAEAQMFSADGQFHCVYSGTSGNYNYLTVYNRDATTPDGSTYYQYSCLVYTTANNIVTTSINPKECFDSSLQTPTSTVHPDGVTRTFTNYSDSNCYSKDNLDLKDDSSSSSTNLIWLYVLIVIIILIIIAIIIFLIWYIRRKRKREQQKVPDEESLQSSEDEEEQKKKDEEQKKADEEQKKKDEQQREASPVPAKEDDRTSIDSGIEQEKKEEKTPVKDKKVVIEDIKDKTEEITVKEQEEEKEQEEDEEEGEKSGSEETASSSRVTTPDPEEIERNIRKIGMKKSINFKPQGELSKVLVSRKMEEKSRKNQEMGKWKKMRSLFRVKTKKIKDVSQKKGNTNELALDSDEEERQKAERENTVAPFMKEYNYKKQMEQQLDEQHVWGGEEDYTDRLKDSDDEDFADIFEVTTNEKGKEVIIEKTKIEEITDENKRSKYSKDNKEKEHLHEDEKSNKKQLTEDQAKDSGVDSPDLKKENTDIELKVDGDEEMGEVEMTEPPPGYIKDSSGRIIRLYDNKVMTEEEMQAIFPLAKLGVLFHVPRLKRTSHGRPTGDYIEDNFGPKLENDKRSGEARDEHSKPKHPRSSRGSAARRETKDQLFQKSVAFEMDDGQSDILMIEDEDAMSIGQGSTEANRELLRKRLFRNKRKLRSRGDDKLFSSDEGRPRELSDLVRVIPQTGQKYLTNGRAAIPGTVVSRNDSLKNKFDPEQQQIYREGLAADKRILEQSPSLKRHPPGVPREAFVHQNPDDIRVSIDNLENEERLRRNQDGINIGSDDEFFLVGNNREQQQEPLFTVRRPGQTTVRPVPGSHDRFCPKHDMRHALPWSLINQYHIRESSILDANSVAKKQLAPKSADNGKREIDDRRLRELLEELYKDKKYFDHMIDTTERNTEPIIDERDLAEHGRDFLLERAEYWDERGEMMPRPPQTALGLRLSRMNTFVPDSGRVSNISYASTVTPQPPPEQLQHHNNVPHAFQKREHTIT